MNVTVSPQAAAADGCSANVSSYRDYYDEGQKYTPDSHTEFSGRFPILSITKAGKWKVKAITVTWEKVDYSGSYVEGYYFESSRYQFGDVVDFFELSMQSGQHVPIADGDFYPVLADATLTYVNTYWHQREIRVTYTIQSIDVEFEEAEYTIQTRSSPTYGGTTLGDGKYMSYSSATIRAFPNEGYIFLHWTKNGTVVSNDSTYSFVVSEDATYVAVFEEVSRKFTITTSAFPVGGGVTSGDGRYSRGEPVTIRAVANPGYKFDVWKKGVLVVAGGSGIYAFSAKEDAEYVAYFKPCGIIYDPSSGKIMYDANAGSILCYA